LLKGQAITFPLGLIVRARNPSRIAALTGVLSVSAQNDLGIARIADKKSVER